jgi:hypothetical protein
MGIYRSWEGRGEDGMEGIYHEPLVYLLQFCVELILTGIVGRGRGRAAVDIDSEPRRGRWSVDPDFSAWRRETVLGQLVLLPMGRVTGFFYYIA